MMNSANLNVPVLIIFWARPWCLEKLFEQVRQARPRKLYLYQDGPREGRPDDIEHIQQCREIVSRIDWECEVHQNYQSKNVGCEPSGWRAIKWAFEREDRCIIFEDDVVPSQSFFPYCAELLERFKCDQRVQMICGMNHLDCYEETPDSYFFSYTGPMCGYATWQRVIDACEEDYRVTDNAYAMMCMRNAYRETNLKMTLAPGSGMFRFKAAGILGHEAIQGLSRFSQSRLCVIPSRNLIENIGYGPNCVHAGMEVGYIPRKRRSIYRLQRHELTFPLRHPRYMINDIHYSDRIRKEYWRDRTIAQRCVEALGRRLYTFRQTFCLGAKQ